jgi:hypothetical protein
MQNPNDPAETSIPAETVMAINGPNQNRTFTERRKAAKRSEPWYQNLSRKKPRLGEPLATTTTDEAARITAATDVSVGLAPPAADNSDTNAEPVTDVQPNAGATRATGLWTPEEDKKLTNAVTITCKKKHARNGRQIGLQLPRSFRAEQKNNAGYNASLDPSIDRADVRKGTWTEDEDNKLKNAVQMHGCKDWVAISALVPGRTKRQCCNRWENALNPSIALTAGRKGKWTVDEDKKLKDAVTMHGGKKWDAIATLVPGRAKKQCRDRWHDHLNPSIALTAGRTGCLDSTGAGAVSYLFWATIPTTYCRLATLYKIIVPG